MRLGSLRRFLLVAVSAALLVSGCSSDVSTAEPDAVPLDQATAPPEPLQPTATDTPAPSPETDVQHRSSDAVRETFEVYRSALLNADGAAAAELVTPTTFDYYDRVLEAGLNATADEILDNSMPLSEALSVLAMRGRLGDELRTISDGAELFAIGVDRGMVGGTVGSVQFDYVDMVGSEAYGVLQGQSAFRFEYAQGAWLVDLPFTTSFVDDSEAGFIEGMTGGSSRVALYELIAGGYGTTWAELAMPIG